MKLRMELDITPALERALRNKFGEAYRAEPIPAPEFYRLASDYIASIFGEAFVKVLADQVQLDAAERGTVQ